MRIAVCEVMVDYITIISESSPSARTRDQHGTDRHSFLSQPSLHLTVISPTA